MPARVAAFTLVLLFAGCEACTVETIDDAGPAGDGGGMDAGDRDAGPPPDTGPPFDAGPFEDAACTSAVVTAEVERLPVDIIWVVDNSVSMAPAIDQVQLGLNDFADLIGMRSLDYRVIMLSLRGMGETRLSGSRRYQVCIPPPLAGANCADNPPVFHQVEIDIRSTQPLEQFLGSLGQTAGYLATDDRGSAPWRMHLRDTATKTIVVVTDDNARMVFRDGMGGYTPGSAFGTTGDPDATAEWFEQTADTSAGSNPWNSRTLPEGILRPVWGGLFDGYTFSALYGWGSETDPDVRCTYPAGGSPPSSGPTYTALVQRTGGVRAQICDGPAAWGPFFDQVAMAVERSSRIACEIAIPAPPMGMFLEPDRINVLLRDAAGATTIGKVPGPGACDPTRGGWYYDDEASPTQVILCPATCDAAQPEVGMSRTIDIQFGCQTIPI